MGANASRMAGSAGIFMNPRWSLTDFHQQVAELGGRRVHEVTRVAGNPHHVARTDGITARSGDAGAADFAGRIFLAADRSAVDLSARVPETHEVKIVAGLMDLPGSMRS